MLAFMRDLRQRDAGGGVYHGQLEIANTNHFNRATGPFRVFVQFSVLMLFYVFCV